MREKLRTLPLLGGFVDTTLRDHASALRENISGLLISLSPLWFGGFIVCLTDAKVNGYFSAVWANASNGELFLFATSVLAPILHMATDDPPGARRFPSKWSHIGLMLVILMLAAGTFGVQRAGVDVVRGFAIKVSVIAFGISIVLLYLATVYKNSRLPEISPEDFQDSEREFSKNYRRHRS